MQESACLSYHEFMKVLVIVEDWISFYVQAEALVKGLRQLGVECRTVTIKEAKADEGVFREEAWHAVLGVGSWYGWEYLVQRPMHYGLRVVPWLVSNGGVNKPEVVELLNGLKGWFTPSEFCRKRFAESGIKIEKLSVIPEAVDDEFWRPMDQAEIDRAASMLGISRDTPVLLTIGGDATSKGAQEVLRGLGKLDPDVPWIYIIKTWPQEHTFRRGLEEFKIITKLNLRERVHYIMGEFSKEFMGELINMCDVYVAPSRGEGFGLPFVQAGMCGKPVISIDALSIKEIVVPGKTGFLVKPRKVGGEVRADINDLADKMKKLIGDKELRETMGRQGLEHCRANFSPRIIAQQFLEKL